MRTRNLDARGSAVVAAVVDGKARRLNARRIVRTLGRRRPAFLIVCDDAHRMSDRRAAARSYLASPAGTCADRTVDSGRRRLAPIPPARSAPRFRRLSLAHQGAGWLSLCARFLCTPLSLRPAHGIQYSHRNSGHVGQDTLGRDAPRDDARRSRRLPSSAPPSASAALRAVRSHPAQKAARLLPFQLHSLLPSTSVASPSTRLPPGFALPTRKGTGRLFHCRT